MLQFRKQLLAFGLLLFGVLACIEPYPVSILQNGTVLTVQGFLTDRATADTFNIKYAEVKDRSYLETPVTGAKVSIVPEGQAGVPLIEVPEGRYHTPVGFRGQVGKRYQLKFTMANGTNYESDFQKMNTVSAIDRVYDTFDARGIVSTDGKTTTAANLLYLDTKDPANEQNFYLWRYTHYELQDICITCDRGLYDNLRRGECDVPSVRFSFTYDYQCDGFCWEVFNSTQVNVLSDINSNGKTIESKLIAKIPLYSRTTGCLVVVEQLGISPDTYRYYKILESQTQTSGGLTDSPPAPIIGNIINTSSPTEPVAGFFAATQVKENRYWINRLNATTAPVGLLGRNPVYEIQSLTRPPKAPCKPSSSRTPVRPKGWGG